MIESGPRPLTAAIVRQMDLHRSERAVLLAILARCRSGSCRVRQADLCEPSGLQERAVRYVLRSLEDAGLITRERTKGSKGYRGPDVIRVQADAYRIVPRAGLIQPARIAAKKGRSKQQVLPVGQPARIAAPIEYTLRDSVRDDESRSRDEDVDQVGAHSDDVDGLRSHLRLISGGRAA